MSDYGNVILKAFPGCLSDTSDYNIDGACVVGGTGSGVTGEHVFSGCAVWVESVDPGGHKIVRQSLISTQNVPYGIAMTHHYAPHESADGYAMYNVGDVINVVTHGRVWVYGNDTDITPTFGQRVRIQTNGTVGTSGGALVNWRFTGGKVIIKPNVAIFEVQLVHGINAFLVVQSGGMNINPNSIEVGATVQARLIAITPAAPDRTGKFSSEDEGVATVDQDTGLITGVAAGTTNIVWAANDSGKYTITRPITVTEAPPEP